MRPRSITPSVVLAIILSLVCPNAFATDVGGTITTNTTWGPGGNPYVFTSNVIVQGCVLTITSVTTIQMNNYSLFTDYNNFANGHVSATARVSHLA